MWNITFDNAKHTTNATSQRHVQLLVDTSIYRCFKTLTHQGQCRQLGGYLEKGVFNTFKENIVSTRDNLYDQSFCNCGNFTHIVPMSAKSKVSAVL